MFYLCGVDPPSPLQIHDTNAFLLLNSLSFRSFFCFPSLNWSGKVKLLVAASPHYLRFLPSFCPPAIESLRDIASNINIRSKHDPCRFPKQRLAPSIRLSSCSSRHRTRRMFTTAISVAVPAFLALLISNVSLVAAFPKISAVGNKFFTDDGKQFYIKGTKF